MSTNDSNFDSLLSVLPVNERERFIKERAERQAQFARELEDRKQQAENELRELKKKSEEELAAKRVIWQEATRQRQIEQQKADAIWREKFEKMEADGEANMRKLRETNVRFIAQVEGLAADIAAMDKFCISKGVQIPQRLSLPFFTDSDEDFHLQIRAFTEAIGNLNPNGDAAQEWVAVRERVNARLKAINDEREFAYEAKAAEARAEAERRQAERDRALKDLEEAQRKVAEADAAAQQASNEANKLDKLRSKASVEV